MLDAHRYDFVLLQIFVLHCASYASLGSLALGALRLLSITTISAAMEIYDLPKAMCCSCLSGTPQHSERVAHKGTDSHEITMDDG